MVRLSGAVLSADQIPKSESSVVTLLCSSVLGVSGRNTPPPPFRTVLHTSLPEVMELEGNYLLTKQAETTLLDILLKYFNFPRNPEKIIPWGSVMNEGIAFQSPDQDPATRASVTAHLA